MPKLRLSAALSNNSLTGPILSEEVAPEGVELTMTPLHPSEMFWRQLKFQEFDISEMSLSSVTIAAAHGNRDWVPIPIFTTRRYFHTEIVVRNDAGISRPEDLVGRRVGVPEYQQTAAVWARGALEHEFGVAPKDLTWFMERPKEMSHGGSTSFNAPPGIDLTYISPSTNIGEMLEQGQLDAALVYIPDRNIVDRSRHPVDLHGAIRTLFSDPQAEGARYFGTAGILPVNHAVVIRRELLDRHPWLALNVYSAFVKAKELAFGRVVGGLGPWTSIGVIDPRLVRDMATSDPLPYGLAGQRFVLQTLELYMREQGLLHGDVGITELFAASTLDL